MNLHLSEKPILFGEETANSSKVGTIQINRPKALNALNTECYQLIESKLKSWQLQTDLAAILIESTGDKAFCAGGDVKSLVQNQNLIEDFFTSEYFIDYWLRVYPKVTLSLVDGICMGGGLGLCQASSYRVMTEKTTVAMPESAIGFFADVGATRFLNDLPSHFGLLMGLSGLRISGAEATLVGLANVCVPHAALRKIRSDLLRVSLGEDRDENLKMLQKYFQPFHAALKNTGFRFSLFEEWSGVYEKVDFENCETFLKSFQNLPLKGERWDEVRDRMKNGSALSKKVFYEAYFRHATLDYRQVFLNEWQMAMTLSADPEFHEGVRAVLIDKDQNAKWRFHDHENMNIKSYFESGRRNALAEKLLNNRL